MAAPTPTRMKQFFALAETGHITDEAFAAWITEIVLGGRERLESIERDFGLLVDIIEGRRRSPAGAYDAPAMTLARLKKNILELVKLFPSLPTARLSPEQWRALERPVDELELSARSRNALRYADIRVLGELTRRTEQEVLKIKNVGRKTLNELASCLAEFGLTFGMQLPNVPPPKQPE